MKIIFYHGIGRIISRVAPLLTVVLFIVWILPLGIFVKPNQEKMFCNGKRAMCMCSRLAAKQTSGKTAKVALNNESGPQKEESSSSSGPYLFLVQNSAKADRKISLFFKEQSILHSFLVVRAIEHVPKV